MGVVFFPSLPFMGVMLFPSIRLGNASGEGGASLALFSLFLFFFFLLFSSSPLFFSPSPSSSSQSLFLLLQLFSPFLPFISISLSFPSFCLSPLSFASFSCSLFLLSFHSPLSFSFRLNSFVPFFSLFFFFFCEGTTCTVCFRGVGDDATDRDPIVIRF